MKPLNRQLCIEHYVLDMYQAELQGGIVDSTWPRANVYFWNIQGRHEVDFIIEAGDRCIAIEAKAGERWEKADLAG